MQTRHSITNIISRASLFSSLLIIASAISLDAQNRDLQSERLILDDGSSDASRNTITVQTPAGGLTADRTVTLPDEDGTIMVEPIGGFLVNQILFGGAGGEIAQSPAFLWNDGTGTFDIGPGNFTVEAASGNTDLAGTLDVDGATTLGDGAGADTLLVNPGTGRVGIGTSTPDNFVEIEVADLNGTSGGATAGEEDQAFSVKATSLSTALRVVAVRGRVSDATVSTAGSALSPRHVQGVNGQGSSAGGEFTSLTGGYFNGKVLSAATDGVLFATGVAADAEIQGGAAGFDASQNLIGGRFGADGTNGGDISATGMLATAIGAHTGANTGVFGWAANASTGVDIGVSGVANSDQTQLGVLLGTLTLIGDFSTGLLGHNETDGANEYALYTTGSKVRLGALAGAGTRLVTADANGVLSATSPTSFSSLQVTDLLEVGDGDATDAITVNSGGGTDLTISEAGVDRNSAGSETFAVENSGGGDMSLLVNTSTGVTNARIVVNEGHWTSQGSAPGAVGDGTNLAAVVTVSASATDVAGQVTATDGGNIGTGVITVSFATEYTTDPIVVVTPGDANAGGAGFFVSGISTTSFDINVMTTVGDGSTTYSFYYQVIEND